MLVNPGKSIIGFILAMTVVFTLTVFAMRLTDNYGLAMMGGFVVILGSGFIAYKLLKKWLKCEVIITVSGNSIHLHQLANGKEKTIHYANLMSYRHEFFTGGQRFYLKLTNGSQFQLMVNSADDRTDDFAGIIQAIEKATVGCRNENGEPIIREPGFFEKPVATVLLIGATVIYALVIWKMVYDDQPIRGNIMLSIGGYIAYLSAWLATLKQRNKRGE